MSRARPGRASASKFGGMPVAVQRTLLCVSVGALVYWSVSGSLFVHFPEVQRALLLGVAVSLIGEMWIAVGSALGISLVGLATGPHNIWNVGAEVSDPVSILAVAVAAIVAGVCSLAGARQPESRTWLFWAATALMVANVWVSVIEIETTSSIDSGTGRRYSPTYLSLQGVTDNPNLKGDERVYIEVIKGMRNDRMGYYEAFAAARPAVVPGANGPTSALNFREPLLYSAVAASPPWLVIGVQLLLLTMGIAGLIWAFRGEVRLPVLLPGIAAVTSFSVRPLSALPLYSEVWAGMLCLISVELAILSTRKTQWKSFVIASAITALLAVLIRELAAALLVGGVLSALMSPSEERVFRLKAWASALIAGMIGVGLHLFVASRHVVAYDPTSTFHEGFAWFSGSMAFALGAFTYDYKAFMFVVGPPLLLSGLLAALGVVGLIRLPNRGVRAMALVLVAAITTLGLLADNGNKTSTGGAANYWGFTSQFVVYGCIPLALTLLPVAWTRRVQGFGSARKRGA